MDPACRRSGCIRDGLRARWRAVSRASRSRAGPLATARRQDGEAPGLPVLARDPHVVGGACKHPPGDARIEVGQAPVVVADDLDEPGPRVEPMDRHHGVDAEARDQLQRARLLRGKEVPDVRRGPDVAGARSVGARPRGVPSVLEGRAEGEGALPAIVERSLRERRARKGREDRDAQHGRHVGSFLLEATSEAPLRAPLSGAVAAGGAAPRPARARPQPLPFPGR